MKQFDVAVIGGGVVGCAILHELTNQGLRCILLEKNAHLINGASAGNRWLQILSQFNQFFDAI